MCLVYPKDQAGTLIMPWLGPQKRKCYESLKFARLACGTSARAGPSSSSSIRSLNKADSWVKLSPPDEQSAGMLAWLGPATGGGELHSDRD